MSTSSDKPVSDTVAKVDGEVAVGEDLQFQRRWWKFERAVWIGFAVILVLDLAGVFGRGPLSKAHRRANDGSIDLRYDRVQRLSTPSIMTVELGPASISSGRARLFVSESLVDGLGAQRVIPAPQETVIGADGLTYSFAVSRAPASVEFALEPGSPGLHRLTIQAVGLQPIHAEIFVMP